MKKQNNTPGILKSFIEQEKAVEPNPFLATRVMAAIESNRNEVNSWYQPVLKPVLAIASLVLVIWMGIWAGSSWVSNPEKGARLENDSQTENLFYYTQPETE